MFKDVFSDLLQKNNINTSQLSKDIGISEAVLSKWKNGKTNPNYDNIKKLSQYFKVSINYLFETNDNENGNIKISDIEKMENNQIANRIDNKKKELEPLEEDLLKNFRKCSRKKKLEILGMFDED